MTSEGKVADRNAEIRRVRAAARLLSCPAPSMLRAFRETEHSLQLLLSAAELPIAIGSPFDALPGSSSVSPNAVAGESGRAPRRGPAPVATSAPEHRRITAALSGGPSSSQSHRAALRTSEAERDYVARNLGSGPSREKQSSRPLDQRATQPTGTSVMAAFAQSTPSLSASAPLRRPTIAGPFAVRVRETAGESTLPQRTERHDAEQAPVSPVVNHTSAEPLRYTRNVPASASESVPRARAAAHPDALTLVSSLVGPLLAPPPRDAGEEFIDRSSVAQHRTTGGALPPAVAAPEGRHVGLTSPEAPTPWTPSINEMLEAIDTIDPDALATAVNESLVEQARRNGVDLS